MQTNTTIALRPDDDVKAVIHHMTDTEQFIVLRVTDATDGDFLSVIVSHTNHQCAERARAIAQSLLAAAETIDPTARMALADEPVVSGNGVQPT